MAEYTRVYIINDYMKLKYHKALHLVSNIKRVAGKFNKRKIINSYSYFRKGRGESFVQVLDIRPHMMIDRYFVIVVLVEDKPMGLKVMFVAVRIQ